MDKYTFLRTIPDELREGFDSGRYVVKRNSIKDTQNTMKFVTELIPTTPEACKSIGYLAPALLSATTALSGANLLVSVAGFKIVCQKLNKIAASLDAMHNDIIQLFEGQRQILQSLEDYRLAEFQSAIDAISDAIEYDNKTSLQIGIKDVNKARLYYKGSIEKLLDNDIEKCYKQSEVVKEIMSYCVVAAITIAHAHAQMPSEGLSNAIEKLKDLDRWLQGIEVSFRKPFTGDPKADWLRALSKKDTDRCCELIGILADMRVGVITLRQQYQFCLEAGMSVRELTAKASETGLVVILYGDSELPDD